MPLQPLLLLRLLPTSCRRRWLGARLCPGKAKRSRSLFAGTLPQALNRTVLVYLFMVLTS